MGLVGGIVLAAGAGRRFGRPKALVEWHGRPLVAHAVETLTAGGCGDVVVVVGAESDRVRAVTPAHARTAGNPEWPTGLASSLRRGLAAMAGTPAVAVVVLPVDMPGVTPEAVRRIASNAGPRALAIGGYGEHRGHPVLLGRDHWPGVAAAATGDRGARDYLRDHHALVHVVPVGDVAGHRDIDVPADLTGAGGTETGGTETGGTETGGTEAGGA